MTAFRLVLVNDLLEHTRPRHKESGRPQPRKILPKFRCKRRSRSFRFLTSQIRKPRILERSAHFLHDA